MISINFAKLRFSPLLLQLMIYPISIIIIIIISFMEGIYIYIPETNYVPREYSVAAILLLLFMVLISLVSVLNLLYFYISTFRIIYNNSNNHWSFVFKYHFLTCHWWQACHRLLPKSSCFLGC